MTIKAIIIDVDGVIIGEKIGFNSPYPNEKVIQALKTIRSKGIPIILCTAKPHFSIAKVFQDANLSNYHITDGGGVIIDPVENKILKKYTLDSKCAAKVIQTMIDNNVYTEFYTPDSYFVQNSQESKITKDHNLVLQTKPVMVDSLAEESKKQEITKIMPIALNPEDKPRVNKVFEPFKDELIMNWGVHPVILPLQFGIITAKGISKKTSAQEIISKYNLSFNNVLGVGDSTSDWQFIQLCKYKAAMGNASAELKDLVSKEENSFVGKSVDENGIINIFEHYKLI